MDKQQVMVSTLMRKQVEQELGLDKQGLVSALVVETIFIWRRVFRFLAVYDSFDYIPSVLHVVRKCWCLRCLLYCRVEPCDLPL